MLDCQNVCEFVNLSIVFGLVLQICFDLVVFSYLSIVFDFVLEFASI